MRKNGNNELNRGTKKSFISILPIIGAGLLSAGALTGVGVSAWHISRTYKESSEFVNSVSTRVKIDPMAFTDNKTDSHMAEENTKYAAEKLSNWLRDNGQDSYDVSYEIIKPTTPGEQYWAYLSAKFKINKVTSKIESEKDDKIDSDPYQSAFDLKGFNTNNRSFIYRWYDSDHKESTDLTEPKYTILNFSDLFVLPEKVGETGAETKAMSDKDNKNGLVYKVKDSEFLNNVYKDILKYETDTKDVSDKKKYAKIEPRFYIVNNLEGLFNEASYHLLNWLYHDNGGAPLIDYLRIYQNSDYYNFAKEYRTKTWKQEDRKSGALAWRIGEATLADKNGTVLTTTIPNSDVLNWIDYKETGKTEHTAIFSKYVETIVPSSKVKDYIRDNIDDDKLKNTIPTTPDGDCKIDYYWNSYSDLNAAKAYLANITEKNWKKAKIVSVEIDKDSTDAIVNFNKFAASYQKTIIAPKFITTIFGGNKLVGILSLGFLIYLIILGIALALLYRTTGVFSWICMMFMLSMTALIAVFGSASVISLSLLFGLFIMSIAGFITALGICSVMKRRLLSNEDTQLIVAKTFKKSLWPAADTSIMALIFGIMFTYIAPLGLNPLGLALIVGSFANFIGTYLFNGLLHALWFNNKITIGHLGWFGKGHSNVATQALMQGSKFVPTTMDATKLEFQHYSKISNTNIKVTNKASMIACIVVGALLIASIVTFCVLGIAQSSMFRASNCLMISCADANVVNWVKEAGINFNNVVSSADNKLWYFYSSSINEQLINQLTASHPELVGNYWLQQVIGSTNRDILTSALFSILVGSAVAAVYAGIRCNWTAFVPMLVGSMGLPLITLGIAAAAQVMFDETVVLAYLMTTVLNQIVCINVISSINAAWSRHEGYSKSEFRFIVNTAFKNSGFWLILVAAAYSLFIVMFGLASPAGCANCTYVLLIGLLNLFIISPFVMSWILYQFLVIRNKLLIRRNKKHASKVVVNYDEIDEQSIEGLNKFSRQIPIPKEDKKANEQ